MDKLEEYIKKNRDELDRYTPSPDIWEKIDRVMRKDKFQLRKWLSIAAMVVIILGSALVFFRPSNSLLINKNQSGNGEEQTSGNPQLKETEIYYNNLVNSLYLEATPLLTGNPEIKKELTIDITQLDSICSDIKKDLKDNVANQEVVEALIQNYRIKIRLLEDMLTLLKENEVNPKKIKSHEL
ncbi:MAG: hypothetical protein WCS03_02555 [Bacteroidota bacterium]